MKTIKLKLYTVHELSQKARDRARERFNNTHDEIPYLLEGLQEELDGQLKRYNIKAVSKPKLYYSLTYSQGDGVMFEGCFEWKKYYIEINHTGHYYHSNSKEISITTNDQFFDEASEKVYTQFEKIYQAICKDLERIGYAHIEAEFSEESFISACEANDYTFEADGTM